MVAHTHIDPAVRNYTLRRAAYNWAGGDAGGYLMDTRETRVKKMANPKDGIMFRVLLSRNEFNQNKTVVKQLSLDLTRGAGPTYTK